MCELKISVSETSRVNRSAIGLFRLCPFRITHINLCELITAAVPCLKCPHTCSTAQLSHLFFCFIVRFHLQWTVYQLITISHNHPMNVCHFPIDMILPLPPATLPSYLCHHSHHHNPPPTQFPMHSSAMKFQFCVRVVWLR